MNWDMLHWMVRDLPTCLHTTCYDIRCGYGHHDASYAEDLNRNSDEGPNSARIPKRLRHGDI